MMTVVLDRVAGADSPAACDVTVGDTLLIEGNEYLVTRITPLGARRIFTTRKNGYVYPWSFNRFHPVTIV